MATPDQHLTTEDLRHLARLADLDIAPDREALVLADLNGQLANLPLIDALLSASTPVAAQPYDPTFPAVRGDKEVTR